MHMELNAGRSRERDGNNSPVHPGTRDERTEFELLHAIATRHDRDAFEELYKRHEGHAYAMALKIVQKPELAREAFQEGMLQVWRNAHLFRPAQGQAMNWILGVIIRSSYSVIRKEKTIARQAGTLRARRSEHGDLQEAISSDRSELYSGLEKLLANLSAQERALLGLYFGARCSQTQIASELGVSQRTISHRLQTILRHLRGGLAQNGLGSSAAALEPALQAFFTDTCPAPEGGWHSLQARLYPPMAMTAFTFPLLLAATMVLAASGAAAFYFSASPETTPEGISSRPPPMSRELQRPLPPGQKAGVDSRPRFSRTWSFEDPQEIKRDFILGPRIQFLPHAGMHESGCLANITTRAILYPVGIPVDRLPLRITFRQKMMGFPAGHSQSGKGILRPCWKDTSLKVFGAFFNIGRLDMVTVSSPWVEAVCYLSEDFTDLWVHGARSSLDYHELRDPKILQIIMHGLHRLDDLRVEEIDPSQLPDWTLYRSFVKEIPAANRASGRYELKGLQNMRPGQRPYLEFFSIPDAGPRQPEGPS